MLLRFSGTNSVINIYLTLNRCPLYSDLWLLVVLLKSIYFACVPPKFIVSLMLLLDETIICCICCKERMGWGWIWVWGYFRKCSSKFILTCLAWNVPAVSRHLSSTVNRHSIYNRRVLKYNLYTFTCNISNIKYQTFYWFIYLCSSYFAVKVGLLLFLSLSLFFGLIGFVPWLNSLMEPSIKWIILIFDHLFFPNTSFKFHGLLNNSIKYKPAHLLNDRVYKPFRQYGHVAVHFAIRLKHKLSLWFIADLANEEL